MSFDPEKAPLISETLLKNRRTLDELAHRRSVTVGKQVKRKRVVRGEDVKIKRPEQFLRESRIKEGSRRKMQRRARKAETRNAPALNGHELQETTGFVVRIHEGRHSAPEIKAALRDMGMTKKYDAMFVKLDEAGITKLKALDAYLAYGYVSKKSVEELVHRRAFIINEGVKVALRDNVMVENKLSKKGMICLDDMSHEIYTLGSEYDAAKNLLCTFKLSAPVGGYEKKVLKKHDEVESKAGFIGAEMEEFLQKIL
jgi:60S ribosomal protein uL30